MTQRQDEQGVLDADRARAELYDTLAQLRDRLDYAQRIDDSVARTKRRLAAEQRENPLVFGAGVVGVALACGVAVWAIASKVAKAFE
jgi:hypothetical protein